MSITRYTAAGSGDGQSWEAARGLDQLTADLSSAQPADEFLIGFDRDREMPVFWSNSLALVEVAGTEDDPVRISFGYIAADGGVASPGARGALPFFRQSGAPMRKLHNPDLRGDPFLVLGVDSGNIALTGPAFSHCGAAGFYAFDGGADATISNVRIADLHATMAGRVIETAEGTTLNGLLVRDCTAIGLERGFARFHGLTNSVLRNLRLDAAMVDGSGTDVCQIISVMQGDNIRFEGISLANAVSGLGANERGSEYIQGDGIVCEENTANVVIVDCHALNLGDGGFDLKTKGVQLIDCSATACKYGIRIWSRNAENLIDRCTITSPTRRDQNVGSCIWCAGSVTVVDSLLRAGDGADAVRFGESADGRVPVVTFVRGSIDYPPGTNLAGGEPGEVILQSVRVNGELVSGRGRFDGDRLDLQTTPG